MTQTKRKHPTFDAELAGAVDPVMGVYAITNTVTGKSYIGSSRNIRQRWYYHLTFRYSGVVYDQVQQYGIDAFTFEVLEPVAFLCDLPDRELAWIRSFPDDRLLNALRVGSQSRYKSSEMAASREAKAKALSDVDLLDAPVSTPRGRPRKEMTDD